MSINPSFTQAEYLDNPTPAVNAPAAPDTVLFTRALLFGLCGALAGAALDAAFIGLTHINIGYLAIVVAWLVAKAMITGSRGQGGFTYQVTAVVLTYFAVSLAHAALLDFFAQQAGRSVPLSVLVRYGVAYPLLRFQSSPAGGLIGLFILFIGLRAAWRMTSGNPAAVRHPFAR